MNGSQLYATNQQVASHDTHLRALDHETGRLGREINKVGALSAAMSGLHPRMQHIGKGEIAMALGNYGGQKALAVGGFYGVNDRVMLSLGAGFSEGGAKMVNLGANFALDRIVRRQQQPRELTYNKQEVDSLLAEQAQQIKGLKAQVAQLQAAK